MPAACAAACRGLAARARSSASMTGGLGAEGNPAGVVIAGSGEMAPLVWAIATVADSKLATMHDVAVQLNFKAETERRPICLSITLRMRRFSLRPANNGKSAA